MVVIKTSFNSSVVVELIFKNIHEFNFRSELPIKWSSGCPSQLFLPCSYLIWFEDKLLLLIPVII